MVSNQPGELVVRPLTAATQKIDVQNLWTKTKQILENELPSQQFATWIRPLSVANDQVSLRLLAPNRFIRDWVSEKYLSRINEVLTNQGCDLRANVGISGEITANSPEKQRDLTQRLSTNAAPKTETISVVSSNTAVEAGHAWEEAVVISEDEKSTAALSDDVAYQPLQRPAMLDAPAPGIGGGSLAAEHTRPAAFGGHRVDVEGSLKHQHALIDTLNFTSFVEGKSNQLARAAAMQVAENPGGAYNPLFIYGSTGLGKTHLMHSVGNALLAQNPNAKIIYLHSERFVADMVKALQLNAINDFKRYYRSVDALLIDDIQFFANKERSQEEFFHTFNALLEGGHQMILTCDRYPKEIKGLEERLKSRFGWGLTVAIEPPELETRAAILMKKAEQSSVDLPYDVALFIAQRVRSNVRDLEGALKRVMASANFHGRPIDEGLVRESLKDLFALQDRQVSMDNIQRTVAEYYKIKLSDLMSKRRSRSVARPRQLAMALAKELTNHSLPEIGNGFGGKDHTTVMHACKKIAELRESDSDIGEDYKNLLRSLTT